MKKRIAVMMCAISLDNQRKILEGIMGGAKEEDCNVFVFTNHVSYNEKELNKQGAFQIMELPEFESFDGVILAGNTIQYKAAVEKLITRIRESGVPVVSIDNDIQGMGYVGCANYLAQKQVVEHIIQRHHKKRIAYVTGQLTSEAGKERLRAYQDALKEAGIAIDEQLIFEGHFDVDSGRKAVHYFVGDQGLFPEAIVCANDNMAIGVLDQLRICGYHVPEDILVTGFDRDEMSQYNSPTITTVDAGQFACGYKAVKILFSGKSTDKEVIEAQMHIGGSCGCGVQQLSLEKLRNSYVETMQMVQQAADCIKNMSTEFAGLENEQELLAVLKKYVMQSDMEGFYLCRCIHEDGYGVLQNALDGQMDISVVHTEYTPQMQVSIAYEAGQFVSYQDISYCDIIPKEAQNGSGNLYVVSPIFYQNYCYGYCVSVNSYFPLKSELFFSWVLNIGIGLENIRKWTMLNATVNRLNSMWVYDMLTHVYNRAGFFHYAKSLLQNLQSAGSLVGLLFIDIDGLKGVNDNQGHHMGDAFIKEIAECLKENLRENQILMRYGGDEFVLFGKIDSSASLEKQIAGIQNNIEKRNFAKCLPFMLGASIGSAIYNASAICDLNEIIELADQKMYEEKRRKKKKL